jgi:hypothetical protein
MHQIKLVAPSTDNEQRTIMGLFFDFPKTLPLPMLPRRQQFLDVLCAWLTQIIGIEPSQ